MSNGIQAAHVIITPTCRANRTTTGAFLEAVRRVQEHYQNICAKRSDIDECDFHLLLILETPRHKQAQPAGEGERGE